MTQNELNLIPYFTRLIKMDRVGFEPTTSAAAYVVVLSSRYRAVVFALAWCPTFPLQLFLLAFLHFQNVTVQMLLYCLHY
jgi:hypothetical protein